MRGISISGLLRINLTLLFIFLFPSAIAAAGKVTMKNINYQSFKGYTRVIMNLSGPVEFTMNHLSNPERFYFDLKKTTLPKTIKPVISIDNNIIKAIRTRQFSKDVVRIVFDLDKAEDFKASLHNQKGTKLVVDVYAKKQKKEPEPPKTKKTDEVGLPSPKESDAKIIPLAKPEPAPVPEEKKSETVVTSKTASITALPLKTETAAPKDKKPETETVSKPAAITVPPAKLEVPEKPKETIAKPEVPAKPEITGKPKEPPVKSEVAEKPAVSIAEIMSSGEKYAESGEYEKALGDFKKASELSPRNAEIHVAMGRSLFKMKREKEAIASYKQALVHEPKSADAYNGLGYAYYSQGNPASATEAFLKAIELDPEHEEAYAGLGYTYLTTGDTRSALEQYRILKGLDSPLADELFSLIFKAQMSEQKKQINTLK